MKTTTFEEKLAKLDAILTDFDQQDALSLEKSLELYEQGIRLIRECTVSLEEAQKRVDALSNE